MSIVDLKLLYKHVDRQEGGQPRSGVQPQVWFIVCCLVFQPRTLEVYQFKWSNPAAFTVYLKFVNSLPADVLAFGLYVAFITFNRHNGYRLYTAVFQASDIAEI